MNNTFRIVGLSALLSLSLALVAQDQAYTIKRKHKVGDSRKYELKVIADSGGIPINFTSKIVEKVLKLEDNGNYHLEETQEQAKVKIGETEQDIPQLPASTTVFDKRGLVLELKSDEKDANAYRVANLSTFVEPEKAVKVGDKWTHELKADSKTGAVAMKYTFELIGIEKSGDKETLKIKSLIKEGEGTDPASFEGHVWLDTKDFSLIKMDGEFKKAPFSGAPGPMDAKITLTRIS